VPVVHDADQLRLEALGARVRDLGERGRQRKLLPDDFADGTITLTNVGRYGTLISGPIINHPQVAILGVGRIIDRPWVLDGQIAIRKLTQLSLVFDHRVCDGGTAAAFLRFVADAFENPASAFADL